MKQLLVFVGLVLAASAEEFKNPFWRDYHEDIGIALATRIKKSEESTDFDGARIVGGQFSSLGQHPHVGGLLIQLEDNRESVCGSSLLSNTRLITAAHCWISSTNPVQMTVVLGSLRLYWGGLRINTRNVQPHANYDPATLNNDVAIIVLPTRVEFNNNINSINIARGSATYVGYWATATGFGKLSDSQEITRNQALSHVSLQVITNQACANVYGDRTVIPSVICTSTNNGRVTSCHGDSGGPLDIGTGVDRVLIGVTSFVDTMGCQFGNPAGFMRVTSFNSWIRRRM